MNRRTLLKVLGAALCWPVLPKPANRFYEGGLVSPWKPINYVHCSRLTPEQVSEINSRVGGFSVNSVSGRWHMIEPCEWSFRELHFAGGVWREGDDGTWERVR